MDASIKQFLQKQRAATVCCTDDAGNPYCFNCFYAFDAEEGLLYFKTADHSHHTHMMLQRGRLSGTILPDELNPLQIKGAQWTGHLLAESNPLTTNGNVPYHRRFPFAMAMHGTVYTIRLDWIKLTDSAKVFAKKTIWSREVRAPQTA